MIKNENYNDKNTDSGETLITETETETANCNVDTDDLQYLRDKYLHGKHKNAEFVITDKIQLVCNILLLCSVIIAAFCSILWFATPTMTLGNNTHRGETQNVFAFLFFGENSMLEQIKATMKLLKNFDVDSLDAITSVPNLLRFIILGISGLYVLITTVFHTIMAIIHFVKHNSVKLRGTAVYSITRKFSAYISFAFLGSMSGGSGSNEFYLGYSVGIGMTVGLALAFCCIIAVVALTYIKKHKTADSADKLRLCHSAVSLVGYTVIAIMLTQIHIYGVFMYMLTSLTQAAAYTVQYSFKISVILFPLLNLIIFGSCYFLSNKAANGFAGAAIYMSVFDTNILISTDKPKKLKKYLSQLSLRFIGTTIASILALIATLLLNIPSIGLGWDFDLYPYLIVIIAISAIGIVLHEILLKPFPNKQSITLQSDK